MIKVQRFVFNPFYENTYLVWNENSKEAVVIDPGMSNLHEENFFIDFIFNKNLQLKYLINTHCHVDHVLGNNFVKSNFNSEFYAPELDLFLLESLEEQAKLFDIKTKKSPLPDYYLSEDLTLSIGNTKLNFIFTPGHTPGEYCVYLSENKILFSGDVLFKESIGRTDLWKGDYNQLINSIKKKIFILSEEVTVYPGHDEQTTIAHEKKFNPYLNF